MKYVLAFFTALFLCLIFPKEAFAQVVINEFFPKSPEWVEFYNKGSSTVDLSNYFFDDDSDFNSDTGSSSKFSLSGLLPGGGLCFWEMSTYLNDSGDSPTLFALNGDVLDSYTYASSSADKSYFRVPDGGSWVYGELSKTSISCQSLPTPTPSPTAVPNACNGTCGSDSNCQSPLVCHEGYCRNASCKTVVDCNCPISTPIPTSTSTPAPTKSSTPKPTSQATETATEESDLNNLVLGLRNELTALPEASESESGEEDKKFPVIPVILIFSGLSCIGFAIWSFLKKNENPEIS